MGGMIVGRFFRRWLRLLPMTQLTFLAVLGLLFVMGAQIGADNEILRNMRSIGLEAFLLTLGAVAGSLLTAFAWSVFLGKKYKKGRRPNPSGR